MQTKENTPTPFPDNAYDLLTYLVQDNPPDKVATLLLAGDDRAALAAAAKRELVLGLLDWHMRTEAGTLDEEEPVDDADAD